MWIFCGGMARSGSTLQFQLTAHLVESAGLGRRVEWVRPEEFPRLREKYIGDGGWKVLKTHVCTAEMRAEHEAENAKAVYVFRDPRDAVVSRMGEGGESFAELWEDGFLDRILNNFQDWTGLKAVLVSRYDDMVADVSGEVARIAAHLGIAVGSEECRAIAGQYTIERQRERIREASGDGRLEQIGSIRYDPISNLHADHIRSGRSGEWRSALAPEELAMIEDRAKGWLRANGYPLALSPWRRALLKLRYARRQRLRPQPDGHHRGPLAP